jgi:glycosyltransferase involved in cell wall biosynthesis
MTLKNRAKFMVGKLEELANQDYDPKKIEVCVTDGGSTDNLVEVLKASAHKFHQIKYAISDRSALPFVIPSNNPACDINAQICNVATFDKIVRTDAEIRFRRKDSLRLVSNTLEKDKELCFCFRSWHMSDKFRFGVDDPCNIPKSHAKMSFHCSCFRKEAFIRNRGVDEAFALGFAAEDSYFHNWWRKNRRFKNAPGGYEVLHLWHGLVMTGENVKLKHDYSLPLYKRFLRENHTPNEGNDNWQRPEMIKDIQIWK